MFTGIVEELGSVAAIERHATAARLTVGCEKVLHDAVIGDSISVEGCCVTVTTLPGGAFTADLMAETLRATALGDLEAGAPVNLERAMAARGRFGGHLVQGHVDGVGEVVDRDEQPGTTWVSVRAPEEVARYLVPKGSVTVAGVSLTVVEVDGAGVFRVGLIPHTLAVTSLDRLGVGDRVNLEADVIAKYVERLLSGGTASPYAAPDGERLVRRPPVGVTQPVPDAADLAVDPTRPSPRRSTEEPT